MIYITKILHHALHQCEKLARGIAFLLFSLLSSRWRFLLDNIFDDL